MGVPAMITWRLWRSLRTVPVNHPVYQRTLAHSGRSGTTWYTLLIEFVAVLLFVPMLAFTSTVYSLAWVISISSTLAGERGRGTYDLLALAPGGALGLSYAVCLACLNRNQVYRTINTREAWIARLLVIGIVLFALTASRGQGDPSGVELLLRLGQLIGVIAFVYIDHVQAILFSSLIGMLTPTVTGERFNAQLTGFAAFVSVELGTLLAALIVGFVLLPGGSALNNLIQIAATVAIFYAAREGLLWLLWRALTDRLNADPADIYALTA